MTVIDIATYLIKWLATKDVIEDILGPLLVLLGGGSVPLYKAM